MLEPLPRIERGRSAYQALRLPLHQSGSLERVTGFEPASSAWKAEALPLDDTRMRRGLTRLPKETERPRAGLLERTARLELVPEAWRAPMLPLHHVRNRGLLDWIYSHLLCRPSSQLGCYCWCISEEDPRVLLFHLGLESGPHWWTVIPRLCPLRASRSSKNAGTDARCKWDPLRAHALNRNGGPTWIRTRVLGFGDRDPSARRSTRMVERGGLEPPWHGDQPQGYSLVPFR